MSLQIRGNSGTVVESETNSRALIISPRPPDVLTGGAFRLGVQSGDLTGVAARTSSAGHLVAFRNPTGSTMLAIIQRIRARWFTNAGFTAAQLIGLSMYRVTGYTAAHTGGTAATLTTPMAKKRTSHAVPVCTVQYPTTGALTAGTQTFDTTLQPLAAGFYSELAAAATVQKGQIDINFEPQHEGGYPFVLAASEGIVVCNEVAMGAGGTARLVVEFDWIERATY